MKSMFRTSTGAKCLIWLFVFGAIVGGIYMAHVPQKKEIVYIPRALRVTCPSFPLREQAQVLFDSDRTKYAYLDGNNDKIACNSLK